MKEKNHKTISLSHIISLMKFKIKKLFCLLNKKCYKKSKPSNSIKGINDEHNIFLYQTPRNKELFNPRLVKIISTLLIIILFAFIGISSITNIREAAIANGEIEPQGNIIDLQHFDGGIVTKINVHEGDSVKQGDVLLELDGIGAKEDLSRFSTKNLMLKLQAERIQSILNDTHPNFKKYTKNQNIINTQIDIYKDMIKASKSEKIIIKNQISQYEYQLQSLASKEKSHGNEMKLVKRIVKMHRTLSTDGYTSKLKLLEEERRLIKLEREYNTISYEIKKARETIQEFKSRLTSYDATHEDKLNMQLENIRNNISENNEQIKKLTQKTKRSHLRSPVAGIIKAKNVNSLGEAVRPNKKLFEIVPFSTPLIATLHINPNDIGHVKTGDLVRIKISAYDYIKYGIIEGKLYHISASTFNKNDETYYKGKVKLNTNYIIVKSKRHYLMPGMLIKAEIVTGERTILEYLLKPIYRSMDGGMVER